MCLCVRECLWMRVYVLLVISIFVCVCNNDNNVVCNIFHHRVSSQFTIEMFS